MQRGEKAGAIWEQRLGEELRPMDRVALEAKVHGVLIKQRKEERASRGCGQRRSFRNDERRIRRTDNAARTGQKARAERRGVHSGLVSHGYMKILAGRLYFGINNNYYTIHK